METTDIWKQVKIDPELAKHVVLSPADVLHLAELAACAENPVEWLSAELTNRGQQRKSQAEARKIQRMKDDAKKIADPASWPVKFQLFVKTQPWETEKNGFRHGCIAPHELTTVAIGGNGANLEKFDSIEDLVKAWSVD
ncbi:hypothetical protein EVC20_160 [Rhizobium phage RHph_Y2_17_1]|nr:hypothetical protein EVC19_160 [Rhizobium phage RHph_Y2_11]QIG75899.1 hypothetical protein EVC20_160 [Rhizobium phage RHph_Y2_17_1]